MLQNLHFLRKLENESRILFPLQVYITNDKYRLDLDSIFHIISRKYVKVIANEYI